MTVTAPGHWRNWELMATRWRNQGIDPATKCSACNHIALQHGGEKDLNSFKSTSRCDWTSCGCPCFVVEEPPAAVPAAPKSAAELDAQARIDMANYGTLL